MTERLEQKLDAGFKEAENRLDKIDVTLMSISKDLERNTDSLQEHMRRTDLLETGLEEALLPIKWARQTAGMLKWLAPIAAAALSALYYYRNIGL